MVTAIVLINVQHGRINEIAEQLVEMEGVAEVYSVGGGFDLVAIIRERVGATFDLINRRGVREVAAARGVDLVDVYQAFAQEPATQDFFPDGLHPDVRGHRLIARRLEAHRIVEQREFLD